MEKAQLIIAHPNKNSLNYALASEINKKLVEKHFKVKITDLYSLARANNQAVNPFDISSKNPPYETAVEQVKIEQDILKNSSLTIVQFPLYWFSYPAVLQSYLEQILTKGFAYPGKFQDSPLADGRQLMLSFTTQSSEQDFTSSGINGDINKITHPMHTVFKFAGYKIIKPFIAFSVTEKSKDEISDIFTELDEHLDKHLS